MAAAMITIKNLVFEKCEGVKFEIFIPIRVIKMGFVVKKGEIFGNGTLGLSDGFIDN